MTEMLKIGLWGCGNMGRSLAQALVRTGEAQLAAVYDLVPEAAQGIVDTYQAQAVPSVGALLSHPNLDGIIVALPPDLHAPAVAQAAVAGLDIFVEKPMSTTVTGCQEMLTVSQQHNVQLMVGQVLRYYEPYRTILRWSAEQRFGALFAASIWRMTDGRRIKQGHWRASRARSGGYLFEVGIHELDMLRCLLGRPKTVSAVLQKTVAQEGEWADYIAVQVRFSSGRAATYEAGGGSHVSRYGFRFYFEGATVTSDAAFDRTALQVHGLGGEEIEIGEAELASEHPVEAELRGWLAALRGEGPVPIPGEEGMASVALARAAYRAAESGQVVLYEIRD
jgi:predicted dehydrogenase